MVDFQSYDLLRQLEGCRLTAYPDEGGVWTIGYGHTGPEVVPGLVWTLEHAETELKEEVSSLVNSVFHLVDEPLEQNQLDALTIFVYNIGITHFAGSIVLRKLNEGRYAEVPSEMKRWIYVRNARTRKMVRSGGLVTRRAAEVALWEGTATEGAIV